MPSPLKDHPCVPQGPMSTIMPSVPLRVAVVCENNLNRSMEAHALLQKKGFSVRSFGTSSYVKLPGPSAKLPVRYTFSTTYKKMHDDLLRRDRLLYTRNGVLHMLRRNKRVKPRPEHFQECRECFDVIFTCEVRVYYRVLQVLSSRDPNTQPVHVINVDMEDTWRGAILGAKLIVRLCKRLQEVDDLDSSVSQVLLDVERETGESLLHTMGFC